MSGLEKRDFNQILNALEDNYRHDLAVHLYLTFLSHRINPHFPDQKWASWPLHKSELPDLASYNRYEDQIEEELVEDTLKIPAIAPETHESIPVTKARVDDLFSEKQHILVTCKNSSPTGPNALLLNELQALVQRKINQRSRLGTREGVQITVDENNELTRQMALKLANKLQGLLEKLAKPNYSDSKGTWQDVHLQALMFRDHGKRPGIDSEKKSYARSKRLFRNVNFNYEYSLDQYRLANEEETDSDVEFEVNHHLQALDTHKQSKRRRVITPSIDILKKAKEREEYKDNVFAKLCSEAENALNFSWEKSDRLTDYSASESYLSTERVDAVATSTLSQLDYIRKR